jgi:hypothetical protein
MAPRILDKVVQIHRPPRQAKAGIPPGKGGGGVGGQPPFIPTDAQRVEVRRMVACGFTNESISVIMTIPQATLERHFPFELKHGKLMTDARILGGIVTQAEEGDKTMSIFWAKARAGWRDVGKDVDAGGGSTVFSINISGTSKEAQTIDGTIDNTAEQPHAISITHRLTSRREEEPP